MSQCKRKLRLGATTFYCTIEARAARFHEFSINEGLELSEEQVREINRVQEQMDAKRKTRARPGPTP